MREMQPPAIRAVAHGLVFDRDGKFVFYLRDDKPTIPFPNHWDLFGGHLEPGETPHDALLRELREEIGVTPIHTEFFRRYDVTSGDAWPNVKHLYVVHLAEAAAELALYEGQELRAINLADHHRYRFANVLGRIVADYAASLPLR